MGSLKNFGHFLEKLTMSKMTYLGSKPVKKVILLDNALNPEKIIQILTA